MRVYASDSPANKQELMFPPPCHLSTAPPLSQVMNLPASVLIIQGPIFAQLFEILRHQLVQLEVCPGLSSVHEAFINDVSI